MIFEPVELISFAMILVAFIVLIINFSKIKFCKFELKIAFILAFLFLLFNRLFTNIEVLFFGNILNFFEHICFALAAFLFALATWLGGKK